ncbi:sulfurtransferase [Lichenicola sp.]|uniref:sulfurtransferase n=1 Tax=Lichenicola sp. TaxID=2804529 RepID=UPI003AFF9904
MSPLLSPTELTHLLDRQRPILLDATTKLPGEQFDPAARFIEAHLPGARRFDIEAFSDPDSSLPHMVPSQGRFARLISELGVSNDSDVVFYDQTGIVSAARGWWLLGLFGHDRVRVLDGGLPAWTALGYPLEQGMPAPVEPGRFIPALRTDRLVGLGEMMALSQSAVSGPAGPRLLDARSRGRFEATVPEPRAGLPGGHIPGAVSLPFTELLLDGTRFRTPDELAAIFGRVGVGPADRVVTSCGSGLTAAVLSLGLAVSGLPAGALYDGSWTEWAQAPGLERWSGPATTRHGAAS